MSLLVIGLMGEMGTGKNYISKEYIRHFFGNEKDSHFKKYFFIEMAFADFLKLEYQKEYPNLDFFKSEKTGEVRKILQEQGSLKRKIDTNYWVKQLENYMLLQREKYKDTNVIVCITDVRFQNEVDFVKKYNGYIIRIYAPKRNQKRLEKEGSNSLHESECIKNLEYDFIYDNDNNEYENDFSKKILDVLKNHFEACEKMKQSKAKFINML